MQSPTASRCTPDYRQHVANSRIAHAGRPELDHGVTIDADRRAGSPDPAVHALTTANTSGRWEYDAKVDPYPSASPTSSMEHDSVRYPDKLSDYRTNDLMV